MTEQELALFPLDILTEEVLSAGGITAWAEANGAPPAVVAGKLRSIWRYSPGLHNGGVPYAQRLGTVLALIRAGYRTLTELSDILGVSKTSVRQVIDRAILERYIEREPGCAGALRVVSSAGDLIVLTDQKLRPINGNRNRPRHN